MTYNFDPEKWHGDQLRFLRLRLAEKEISQGEYDAGVLDLEDRLNEMWKRLDGSYRIETCATKTAGPKEDS